MNQSYLKTLILFLGASTSLFSFSQDVEKKTTPVFIGGTLGISTKGISTIPNLSSGKPALLIDLTAGKGRFSFDPQFYFDLDSYKPWTFVLWGRYKILDNEKFRMNIGAHPAFAFNKIEVAENGTTKNIVRVNRTLSGEFRGSYSLTKNIAVGPYYIYVHSLERDLVRNTHYMSLMGWINNIRIVKDYYIHLNPQVYYVRMDDDNVCFAATSLTLSKKEFPLTISCFINKKLTTNKPVGDDFLWNLSLSYTFHQKFFSK